MIVNKGDTLKRINNKNPNDILYGFWIDEHTDLKKEYNDYAKFGYNFVKFRDKSYKRSSCLLVEKKNLVIMVFHNPSNIIVNR